MNIYSKQDEKDDEDSRNVFNWKNLIERVSSLVGLKIIKNKIRSVLSTWVQNLKRKHEYLLYWNLDAPVLTLSPILLVNFPMLASSYIISHLFNNYTKIKAEIDSINESILYTLQIEFSRVTDPKELMMS